MKIILNLIIMIILLGISFFLFGSGFTTFLLNSSTQALSSFANIFSNATSDDAINHVINFILNLVKTIGLILAYYFVASLIRRVIMKEPKKT